MPKLVDVLTPVGPYCGICITAASIKEHENSPAQFIAAAAQDAKVNAEFKESRLAAAHTGYRQVVVKL